MEVLGKPPEPPVCPPVVNRRSCKQDHQGEIMEFGTEISGCPCDWTRNKIKWVGFRSKQERLTNLIQITYGCKVDVLATVFNIFTRVGGKMQPHLIGSYAKIITGICDHSVLTAYLSRHLVTYIKQLNVPFPIQFKLFPRTLKNNKRSTQNIKSNTSLICTSVPCGF